MNNDIKDFINNLQELIDTQKLLDEILSHYDIYKNEFDNQKIQSIDKDLENLNHYYDKLNYKIRNYLKFNDSE